MEITDFRREHIEKARVIAAHALEVERRSAAMLPAVDVPGIDRFAENGLGVAAIDGGEVVGYMCTDRPHGNFLGTAVSGVWSPLHANGVEYDEKFRRGEVFSRMYQAGAEKWLSAGVMYHSVTVYAHDDELVRSLFDNNFGKRCVDAVCTCDDAPTIGNAGIRELEPGESPRIRDLRRGLAKHLTASPCFMAEAEESWYDEAEKRDSRIFVMEVSGDIIGYVEVGGSGENFLSGSGKIKNIRGAFCAGEYRGRGFMVGIVDHVRGVLRSEGDLLLGVDYESINPNALRFWSKRFLPYTFGLTRRIG